MFAAGDDVLAYVLNRDFDLKAYQGVLSPHTAGRHGLGILLRDLKMGYLHEMDFLSKNFMLIGNKVECYRKESKVAYSGTCTRSIGPHLTVA